MKTADKIVNAIVNGNDTGLRMKLGKAGEAFFLHETEEICEEASPVESPTNKNWGEVDWLSFDALSKSSDEEKEDEIELHYSDIQDKNSDEVLEYLK